MKGKRIKAVNSHRRWLYNPLCLDTALFPDFSQQLCVGWKAKRSWEKREFFFSVADAQFLVVFPQPVFATDVEGAREVVDLLALADAVLEHVTLHVLPPGPAPLGAGLSHQTKAGVCHHLLHHGRCDVAQLKSK